MNDKKNSQLIAYDSKNQSCSELQKETELSKKQDNLCISQNQDHTEQVIPYEQDRSLKILFFRKKLIIGCIVLLIIILFVWISSAKSVENINTNQGSQYSSDQHFDLHLLNTTSALCLDGSPGAYYVSRSGNPKKIYLHFQSGGWCGGPSASEAINDCYQRSMTWYGTSTTNPITYNYKDGLNQLHQDNYFKDWKKVIFRYCDGTGHQGYRKEPVEFQGKLIYFRGHNITIQTLEELETKFGLFTQTQQVIVGGSSAGGVAAIQWGNYIADRVKNGKVKVLSDAGIFLNAVNINSNKSQFIDHYKGMLLLSNEQIDAPVPQCIKNHPHDRQQCMLVENIHAQLKIPLFSSQSLYDSWSIRSILGIYCITPDSSMAHCSQYERKIIEDYKRNLTKVLTSIAERGKNGVWGINCAAHQFVLTRRFNNENYKVAKQNNLKLSTSITNWIQNKTSDHINMDTSPWPGNKPCSGL